MSKERCEATQQLMKQALALMQSGTCGQGRGVSLAITYLEDAYLRVDYHMREQGWKGAEVGFPASMPGTADSHQAQSKAMAAASQQRVVPRVNNLAPAATIPQLKTGLMNAPVAATDAPPQKPRRGRPSAEPSDMDLL